MDSPALADGAHGNILKLYVDSTSLSLVEQMFDYVQCAEDPNVFKIITWLRLAVPERHLILHNAAYVPQMAAVSADFVDSVRSLVVGNPIRLVEIHSNQTHAWRGVVPLMRALVGPLEAAGIALRLHLYDDGSLSVMQRETLKSEAGLDEALRRAALDLGRAIQGLAAPSNNVLQSHAWHLLFDTTYHMLRRDLLCSDEAGRRVNQAFAACAQDMQLDQWASLSETQRWLYLSMFGIGEAERAALQSWASDPKAWLFTGTATWDAAPNERLGKAQLRTVQALRESGRLPEGARIGFKAHPANPAYNDALRRALGEDVLEVPAQVPLEVLLMAKLLPSNRCGVLSSAFFTLPPTQTRFVVVDASSEAEALALPLVRLMLRAGAIVPEQVLPWAS